MSNDFKHVTVLKEKSVEGLNIKPGGTYVDCTLGGAGHSQLIVNNLDKSSTLVGLDQDEEAIKVATRVLENADCIVHIIKSNFINLKEVLQKLSISKIDGILFDLGVSSPQLDNSYRGFSYHEDARLDMRMDSDQEFSAYDIVNRWSEERLIKIFFEYGEERFSKRIAKEIIKQRQIGPITTTLELVELIKQGIPIEKRRVGPHPARRVFQAIRIAVNNELDYFKIVLEEAIDLLKPQGRICVITFHSLEDRICKNIYKKAFLSCECDTNIPICICNKKATLKPVTKKPIIPNDSEIEANKRSRSAKLRIAEKL